MNGLPLDLLHWFLALLPLAVLLVLLVVLRWKAPQAGPVGMVVAAAIALLAFATPWETLAVASAKGVWDAIFILYVVWPALLLYHTIDRAGAFHALRHGIERFSNNELFLVLAFGWVFASFLQGITGFGAPIAVVAPLLIALGVRPVYAVVIPLIGHAWANLFGTLAVAWLATETVVDLIDPRETAIQTAVLLWIPNLFAGFAIAWLYGRMPAVRHAWPLVLILTLIHGGGQILLALWNPLLSAFIAATVALVALYPLSYWRRYSEPAEGIEERPAMRGEADETARERTDAEREEPEPAMGLLMALVPYAILAVTAIVGLAIPAVEAFLEQVEVGLRFPAVETGYTEVIEAAEPYSPFAPFTHPGSFLLLATILTWLLYRSRGFYDQWAQERGEEGAGDDTGFWAALATDAVPASVAIVTFLVMSMVMDHSGQTELLALGIATVAPPVAYAFAANWIGMLGSFMTSSNTASNILLAPLQEDAAAALEGLSEPTIIAAQNAGGATGNAISPANVVLGTGTAGIVGREGEVLRKTLVWAAVVALTMGFATVVLNGVALA